MDLKYLQYLGLNSYVNISLFVATGSGGEKLSTKQNRKFATETAETP